MLFQLFFSLYLHCPVMYMRLSSCECQSPWMSLIIVPQDTNNLFFGFHQIPSITSDWICPWCFPQCFTLFSICSLNDLAIWKHFANLVSMLPVPSDLINTVWWGTECESFHFKPINQHSVQSTLLIQSFLMLSKTMLFRLSLFPMTVLNL